MSSLETDKLFTGSIAKLYEAYLVPLIFEPYAADLGNRLASRSPGRVLEIAAGTGVVIVPMSVARLYHRKDVVQRPVSDLEPTTVALAWLVERDDDRAQRFVGVVRGRTARSSR